MTTSRFPSAGGVQKIWLLFLAACWMGNISQGLADGQPVNATEKSSGATPEERAIDFLSVEVPSWNLEHKCFSCHNNGDAARALYSAIRASYAVGNNALADTSRWLAHPTRWKDNGGGKGPFNDTKLAAIQFAAALAEAAQAGLVEDKAALVEAAALIAETQEPDGSWKVAVGGIVGSPVTYGRFLATSTGRRILWQADATRFKRRIEQADRWLRCTKPETVLDAASVLLTVAVSDDVQGEIQRKHCLELIHKGQAKNGGWGPYVNSVTEPFDTAVVLLALSMLERDADKTRMLKSGRDYLIVCQQEDGSWIETTRPGAGASYAQRLSTTGWATMALLATRPHTPQDD